MNKKEEYGKQTCNMYMSDLRHIHDLVLSSLKMEGICLVFHHCLHYVVCM
jgi:hypothetical protein